MGETFTNVTIDKKVLYSLLGFIKFITSHFSLGLHKKNIQSIFFFYSSEMK